jgi:type I restriction-modification system DNA methylase subunit/predicted type IV restriction endonuclease
MAPPDFILTLIKRFAEHREAYKNGHYNETQTRREFIDPLFEALGWDVANKQGHAQSYREVVHEDALKIGRATKAPDYSFRVGGKRKFFVEAKKPSIYLKDDPAPAYQLRRYAWSAKLPLSIVTDFEEFAVYDCRIRPYAGDSAATARLLYLTYDQYVAHWDEIAGIFSREAVLDGRFDRFAEANKQKRGTSEVDDAFLGDMENWRDVMARHLALRNPQLSQRELNFAVQITLDRIVFLRICEDRGIEPYGRLQSLLKTELTYSRLLTFFYEADQRYNSGLFYFNSEKSRNGDIDKFTPNLSIDDAILKTILKKLYYPDSPYEFSVISADILGQVYERFLGKIIRLTAGHRAKVEEKPEVRKAGGVFYTPVYIVNYIVKNTVGWLLDQCQTTAAASKLKILDPACGSGSFLIGAYQYLLDWHKEFYVKNNPQKHTKGKNPVLVEIGKNEWKLSITERKRILLANIFGVDIDPQAVEVTKLSLLLKVLEGEDKESLQAGLFKERVLPDLAHHIYCGNSLIGPDFYENEQASLLNDEDEMYRINVFDWNSAFSDIIKNGGFDAVIGNPPYGFHQIHAGYLKPYFKKLFESSIGSFEHYFLFYERALKLVNKNGIHGFISPVTWITIPSALSLRKFILNNFYLREISWLPEFVFRDAKVNTLISIIENKPANVVNINIYDELGFKSVPANKRSVSQEIFIKDNYTISIFSSRSDFAIINKIRLLSENLSEFSKPCSGYNPYEVGKGEAPNGGYHTKETVLTKPYHSDFQVTPEWKPEIVGRNLHRYHVNVTGKRWIKYGHWLAAPRDKDNFLGKRLLVQEITGGIDKRIVAAYYEGELYHSRDVIPIKIVNSAYNAFYLLGIINSKLISWYHLKKNPKAQKGLFPKVLVSDLAALPIRKLDLNIPGEARKHRDLVDLVQKMIALSNKLDKTQAPHPRQVIHRQIQIVDDQIDRLVYELYELTEDEIRLIEEKESL